MGWRDAFASVPSREDRKYGKDEAITPSYLSGISDLPGGAPDPVAEAGRARVLAMLDQTDAELRRLVPLVTSHLDYFKTERERAEALENALKHPDLALPFWRGKAKQLKLKVQ